jgi:hypothetical protein
LGLFDPESKFASPKEVEVKRIAIVDEIIAVIKAQIGEEPVRAAIDRAGDRT